ncbi:hypothetical protein F5144DRAFT_95406 [Chaetomium tenue]|uniref:Uncharacterized protein n=1 Tax=Chaetomium tenue TaxID=1854479 RepID=A0ACB7PFA6_9PEZI|nr:hypothetical protein F5144DRAFT_95406 [Chaetomium globosum]
MDDHLYRRPGSHQGTRRPSFVPPRVNTDSLRHDEFMWPLWVMAGRRYQAPLDCLFSRDWPAAFIHAKLVEVIVKATKLPIVDFEQSYQTPMGHITCTRAFGVLVRPDGLDNFHILLLPILETDIYPYGNIPIIMGQPQVTYFMGPNWPPIEADEALPPLIQPDFSSSRHSYTFPGAPAMYNPTATGGFYNNTLLPASPSPLAYTPDQTQVNFPQVGHYTFPPAAMMGGLSREDQTRMWVDHYNGNGGSGSDSNDNGGDDSGNNVPFWTWDIVDG